MAEREYTAAIGTSHADLGKQERYIQARRQIRIVRLWQKLVLPPAVIHCEQTSTPTEREHCRRARLTAVIVTCSMSAPLLVVAQAMVDPITAVAAFGIIVVGLLALVLNRFDHQKAAAILCIVGCDALIEGSLIAGAHASGLSTAWLQTFDLLVLPLIFAGMLLPLGSVWLTAAAHCLLILGDYYLLPHAPDLVALVHQWNGDTVAFARPLAIQIVTAALCFVTMRSTLQAIARADRAERVAELEHKVAEQQRQLESGVREILDTLVKTANGDRTARIRLHSNNLLWQVALAINNVLSRLQRSERESYKLKRTEEEIQRLAVAMDEVRHGRYPLWPALSGTAVDALIERVRGTGAPASSPGAYPASEAPRGELERPHAPREMAGW